MKAGQFAPAELATILVIEDDPRVQEMLGLQLSTLGYQVLQALDGISGLRWLEQEAVGVVILDLNLPDTSGVAVLEQVTRQRPEVPVIVLTGYADVDVAAELMRRGAFYYLTKPVKRSHLQAELRRALEQRALAEERRRLEEENRRYQQELERLVERRTRSLQEANQRLLDLQAQLARADRADSLEMAISSVAHELRNPLAVIQAYLDLIQGTALEPLAEEAFEAIGHACRQMLELLAHLRDLGRPREFWLEGVELAEVLETAQGLTRAHCWRVGVQVHLELGPPGLCILADRGRLLQVLLNLILNACQAMPTGGRLLLAARPTPDPEHVELVVEDSGLGIEAEHTDDVLRPFFTTRGSQGTGLGLSISREIVEMHGGFLVVDSEVGRGTRMSLVLPVRPEWAVFGQGRRGARGDTPSG